jgi:hypothetical protein
MRRPIAAAYTKFAAQIEAELSDADLKLMHISFYAGAAMTRDSITDAGGMSKAGGTRHLESIENDINLFIQEIDSDGDNQSL